MQYTKKSVVHKTGLLQPSRHKKVGVLELKQSQIAYSAVVAVQVYN